MTAHPVRCSLKELSHGSCTHLVVNISGVTASGTVPEAERIAFSAALHNRSELRRPAFMRRSGSAPLRHFFLLIGQIPSLT